MEDNPAFNAGKGAALTLPGHIETDASIMRGSDMAAGSVASISGIRNPIVAARKVLEQTPHVQLAGDSASNWAVDQGCETEDEVIKSSSHFRAISPETKARMIPA